jgi:SAM-dependent methyltransferase/cephalosporin hydroxylase
MDISNQEVADGLIVSNSNIAPNYEYWRTHGGEWADEYEHRKKRLVFYHIQELMLANYFAHSAPVRVFEYGCGVGRHLNYLNRIPNVDVYGYDQSQTMVNNCHKWTSQAWLDQHVIVGPPVGKLPYPDRHFDIVFTAEVLIHVSPADLEPILTELIRISRWQILHIEPSLFDKVIPDAHHGCWNHDFVSIYQKMGYSCEMLLAGFEIHAPYRVILDTERKPYTWSPVELALMRRLENDIQPILNQIGQAQQSADSLIEQLAEAQASTHALTEQLNAEREHSGTLVEQLAEEQASTHALTEQLAEAQASTHALTEQLNAEREHSGTLVEQLAEAQASTHALTEQLTSLQARSECAAKQLTNDTSQLAMRQEEASKLAAYLQDIGHELGVEDSRRVLLRTKELKSEVEYLKRSGSYQLGSTLRHSWPLKTLRRLRHHSSVVKIHVLGKKNPDSHDTQVWLLAVRTKHTPEGIPLYSLDYETEKWQLVDDIFVPHARSLMTKTEANINIYTARDRDLRLDFLMHNWSGQVAIVVAGQYFVFDLYAETHRSISIYPFRSPLEIVPLETTELPDLQPELMSSLAPRQFNNPVPSVGEEYDSLLRIVPKRFDHIYDAPALMSPHERVLMYSLVFALKPKRCLEIGTSRGGSASIIVAGLDDLDEDGRLICIDPVRWISDELWAALQHRTRFIQGASPEALLELNRDTDGPFDFVNIDGLHDYDHALADARGVLPYLADEAYILFHDSYYFEVEQAIDQFLKENGSVLTDLGMLARSPNPEKDKPETVWGGIRVLRYRNNSVAS